MERLSGHDDTVDGCVEVLQPKSIPDQMLLKVLESNMQATVCFSQHFSPHNTKYMCFDVYTIHSKEIIL